MFGKTLKTVVAIFLVPVVIAAVQAFIRSLGNISAPNGNLYLFAAGFFAYPIFHIAVARPVYIYTVGHEIMHVLATWICGGKVTSFHVAKGGGSISTTKNNLFISLSPYFIPIHMIFLAFLYWALSRFYDLSGYSREFVFLMGFTLSFHIFMTCDVMKTRQPDLVKTGYLFSVLLIFIANIVLANLVLTLVFPDMSFVDFAKDAFYGSKDMYIRIFDSLFKVKDSL